MDALDIAILRTMGIDPYSPTPQGPDALKPGTIGRALGVTPETVRDRVQRLEEQGVIAGWQAYPNLRHFGMEAASYLFRTPDEAHRVGVAERLAPVDGVMGVHTFLGREVCVDVVWRSDPDLKRRIQLIGGFTGDVQPEAFAPYPMPPTHRALTHLDWRIVQALRGRARRSLADVGEEVGVGYRTVKRHYDRLCTEGSLFTVPMVDPGKMGAVPFWLLFNVQGGAGKDLPAKVARKFQERLLMGSVSFNLSIANYGVLLVADTPGQVEDLRAQAAGVAGVTRASVLVPVVFRDCSGWLDDLIAARIRETAPTA